jgi:hypothetical protein
VKTVSRPSARDVARSVHRARMRAGMHAFMQTIATSRKQDGKHAQHRSGARAINSACHHARRRAIAEA